MSWLCVSACPSQLDGYIARTWPTQKSALGSALDPLADKILISILYISLTYADIIPGIIPRVPWEMRIQLAQPVQVMTCLLSLLQHHWQLWWSLGTLVWSQRSSGSDTRRCRHRWGFFFVCFLSLPQRKKKVFCVCHFLATHRWPSVSFLTPATPQLNSSRRYSARWDIHCIKVEKLLVCFFS